MIPAAFDYVRAGSAEEAISLLAEHGDEAKLLAGGHCLLPLMKLRLAQPTVLIDIGRLTDLSYIRDAGDHIAIGALTRHHDVETSDVLAEHVPLLAHAAGYVGDPQVRHRGTIGGSIAHADPASDLPATTLALGATLRRPGPDGDARDRRRRLLRRASSSRRSAPDELLTEIRVPKMRRRRVVLPEVQPPGPGLGHRRRRRLAPQRRRRGRRWSTWARRRSSPPSVAVGPGGRGVASRTPPSRPSPRPTRRPTSTPASSTAPTWPRSSPAGPSKPPPADRPDAPRSRRSGHSRSREPLQQRLVGAAVDVDLGAGEELAPARRRGTPRWRRSRRRRPSARAGRRPAVERRHAGRAVRAGLHRVDGDAVARRPRGPAS